MLSYNPLFSPSRCSWEWDCCSFCVSTNLITERESRWEPFVWTLTPPFLSPSPSPQRGTCALHNSLSQNKQHIWAAGRRMACLSRNESLGMTPWKRGLVAHRVPLPWTPTLPLIDRRWTVLLIEKFMTKVSEMIFCKWSVKFYRGPHSL